MSPSCPAANIGPDSRRFRLFLGAILLAFSAGLLALLVGLGVPRWCRLLLFLPLWGGALGLLQARAWTCVFLAARGSREGARGEEKIADPELARQLSRQAGRVHFQALLIAAAGTLLGLLVPVLELPLGG